MQQRGDHDSGGIRCLNSFMIISLSEVDHTTPCIDEAVKSIGFLRLLSLFLVEQQIESGLMAKFPLI